MFEALRRRVRRFEGGFGGGLARFRITPIERRLALHWAGLIGALDHKNVSSTSPGRTKGDSPFVTMTREHC
jgi:hypothetical protein